MNRKPPLPSHSSWLLSLQAMYWRLMHPPQKHVTRCCLNWRNHSARVRTLVAFTATIESLTRAQPLIETSVRA